MTTDIIELKLTVTNQILKKVNLGKNIDIATTEIPS